MLFAKKYLPYVVGCALASTLSVSQAQTGDTSINSDHEFTGNAALTTDYLFRGVTQSNEGPAIQGGFDYTHLPSGFYLGTWASSIEFNADGNSDNSSIEWDFWGGLSSAFANGINWDIGVLYYYYPEQDEDRNAGDLDCLEFYGGLDYTFEGSALEPTIGAKLSYSGDYFGEDDNAFYAEGSLDLALPEEFGLGFHVGHANVDGDKTSPGGYDYTHWSIGLSKEVAGFGLDLSYNDATDEDDGPCTDDDLCKAVVFEVSRTF